MTVQFKITKIHVKYMDLDDISAQALFSIIYRDKGRKGMDAGIEEFKEIQWLYNALTDLNSLYFKPVTANRALFLRMLKAQAGENQAFFNSLAEKLSIEKSIAAEVQEIACKMVETAVEIEEEVPFAELENLSISLIGPGFAKNLAMAFAAATAERLG